jgi:hypothetical protein
VPVDPQEQRQPAEPDEAGQAGPWPVEDFLVGDARESVRQLVGRHRGDENDL